MLLGVPCLAVLAAAAMLDPAGGGHGTHEQMGIPPCSLLSQTGWPCPSCGLTTSVTATAHGELGLAWRSQPFGLPLFVLLTAGALGGVAELVGGRSLLHRVRPRLWWVWVLVGGMAVGWGYKALTGYLAGQYPLP